MVRPYPVPFALKMTLFAVVLLYVFIALFLMYRSYNGYCFEESRYLDEQEFYRRAVSEVFEARFPPDYISQAFFPEKQAPSYQKPKNAIPYNSLEEFLQMNPNCCTFTETIGERGTDIAGWKNTNFEKLTGTRMKFLKATFQVPYLDEDGTKRSVTYQSWYPISSCGKRTKYCAYNIDLFCIH
jgi:hypothetical protein